MVALTDGSRVIVREALQAVTAKDVASKVMAKQGWSGGSPYGGEYEFTPTRHAQTIPTASRLLSRDIVINPIPQNYGLITWNGSVLTVS